MEEKITKQEESGKIVFTYSAAGGFSDLSGKARCFEALKQTEKGLSALNLSRGSDRLANTSGFVFEYLDAADVSARKGAGGTTRVVLNNNGPADSVTTDALGNTTLQQAKRYPSSTNSRYQTDLEKYKDQTMVIPKGETKTKEYFSKKNIQVEESGISVEQSDEVTNLMKTEARLNGGSNAPITSKLVIAADQLRAANNFAVKSAKGTAAFTAGFSFGSNVYDLVEGNMELQELILLSARDSALAFGSTYAGSAATYFAAGTLSQTAIVAQTSSLLVSTGAGSTLVAVGNATAAMSAALGPAFLLGMAVGTGCATVKVLKKSSAQYRHRLSQINSVISETLASMEKAQRELRNLIDETFTVWDEKFEAGFHQIHAATLDNNFEQLSRGLDTILNVFGENVAFKTMEEFDQFFFDDSAVFTL